MQKIYYEITKTMNNFTIFAKMHIKGEIKKKGE